MKIACSFSSPKDKIKEKDSFYIKMGLFLISVKAQREHKNINCHLRQEERKSFSVILGGFQKSCRYKKQYQQKESGEKTSSVFKKKHMTDDIDHLRKTEKI